MSKSTTHKVTLSDAEQFFYDNAGYSYHPGSETVLSGKTRGAILLAYAARTGARKGWTVDWSFDPDADNEPGEGYFVSGAQQWQVRLYNANGEVLESLGGIDLGFGGDGEPLYPADSVYSMVVSAELMLTALGDFGQGGHDHGTHPITPSEFNAAIEDMRRVQRNLDEDRLNHDTVREQTGEDA